MRIDVKAATCALSPELRTRARDRIRLAMGRHAPDLVRVRAVFQGPGPSPDGPGTGLRMIAVLRDGRSFEVDEGLPSGQRLRLEELVDRVAHRVARGVQRTLGADGRRGDR